MSIDGVSKTFQSRSGPVQALDTLSLDVEAGSVLTIVGRSGCGKSTLLRLVAGLTPTSTGRITIDGELVRGPHPSVGLVFQKPVLLPWRTAFDNVMLPADIIKQSRSSAREQTMAMLELVGLAEFADKYPGELSGGMQQRVAVARALVQDPSLLLMDEPFGALDALTREQLTAELVRMLGEQPRTVVFVTHDIEEAVLLADRILVLSERPGRSLAVIPVELPWPRSTRAIERPEFADAERQVRSLLGVERD